MFREILTVSRGEINLGMNKKSVEEIGNEASNLEKLSLLFL
jgi:hypothetical protein